MGKRGRWGDKGTRGQGFSSHNLLIQLPIPNPPCPMPNAQSLTVHCSLICSLITKTDDLYKTNFLKKALQNVKYTLMYKYR